MSCSHAYLLHARTHIQLLNVLAHIQWQVPISHDQVASMMQRHFFVCEKFRLLKRELMQAGGKHSIGAVMFCIARQARHLPASTLAPTPAMHTHSQLTQITVVLMRDTRRYLHMCCCCEGTQCWVMSRGLCYCWHWPDRPSCNWTASARRSSLTWSVTPFVHAFIHSLIHASIHPSIAVAV